MRTARACRGGRRWAGWAALLIGATSAPQAAASGFHAPYTIPDTATAALGVLLTVAVLATAGLTGQPGYDSGNPCAIDLGGHPVTHGTAVPAYARDAQGATTDAGPGVVADASAECACTVTDRTRTAQSASISTVRAIRTRAGDQRA
jgi:hypothetical protein